MDALNATGGRNIERIVAVILLVGSVAGVYAALSAEISSAQTSLIDLRVQVTETSNLVAKWQQTEEEYDHEVRLRIEQLADKIASCRDNRGGPP